MKVCVIGGAGYIGSHAVYELIRDNHEVVVIDNLSTGDRNMVHANALFYLGDITNKQSIDDIFRVENVKKPFDVVMHFAAKLIVPESVEKPLEYYFNNVEGVRILLETMKEHKLRNVVFSSTAAVYGEPVKPICEENDLTIPINPYGESKLACEKLIKAVAHAHDFNYCIFRYFNVAGADHSMKIGLQKDVLTHLIPVTVQTLLGQRDKMSVYGNDYETTDGTCVRDYIHITDLVQAHVLGAKYIVDKNESLLLNLGSNEGYSVLEIINEVSRFGKVNYEIIGRRTGDPAKLIASNSKAMEMINWYPKYNLSEIIESDIKFRRYNEEK